MFKTTQAVPDRQIMDIAPMKTAVSPPQPDLKGKGVSFQHLREFVHARFGEGAWMEVLAKLGSESRRIFTDQVLASAWYPYSAYVEAEKIVVARFLGGDDRLAREIGAHDLEAGLKKVHKALFKVGSPEFIIRMSAVLWRQYFNLGKMVIEKSGRGHANARIDDFLPPDEVCCWDIFGSMVRGLELSGARSIRGDHTACPLKGDAFMKYEARWDE